MYFPIEIEVQNVASHKHTIYKYSDTIRNIIGTLLPESNEKRSNGAGKSILPECFAIALTGENFRKVRLAKMIRDGETNMNILLKLYSPIKKHWLCINRKYDIKGSQTIKIFDDENCKSEVKLSGIDSYQSYINDCTEISKEDLFNYFIVQKEKYQQFFQLTDSKQKDIISRFAGSNVLKGIDKTISEKIKEYDSSIQLFSNKIITFETKIKTYQEEIEEYINYDFEKEKNEKINKLKDQIKEKEELILKIKNKYIPEYEKNIKEYNLEIKNLNKEISNIKDIDIKKIDDLNKEIDESDDVKEAIKEALQENNEELRNINDSLLKLNKSLLESIICPKCDHVFSLKDKNFDIKKVKEEIRINEKKILELNELIKEIESDNKSINEEINLLNKQIDQLTKEKRENEREKMNLNSKIFNIQKQLNISLSDLENSNNKINSFSNEIEELKEKIKKINFEEKDNQIEEKIKSLKQKIKDNQENCKVVIKDKEQLEKEKEKYLSWTVLFKHFDTYLANQGIKTIEGYTNYYLEKMKSNLSVLIEGQKVLASGDLREEIECFVIKDGCKMGDFNRFSSGERTRVSVANMLAFQKIINLNVKNNGGLALCIMDEIIESCDSSGVKEIINSLIDIHQPIEVITHTNHNIRGIEIVNFIKENEETRFELIKN